MKYHKETENEDIKRVASMERSKEVMKEKYVSAGINAPNQNTIKINIICCHFIIDGKSAIKFN